MQRNRARWFTKGDGGMTTRMLLREHPAARCPWCSSKLYFGLKAEAKGWKVHYACAGAEGCARELSPGRIARDEFPDRDAAYQRAEELGCVLY